MLWFYGPPALALIVAVVSGAYFVGFRLSDARKRSVEGQVRDVAALEERPISRRGEVASEFPPERAISRLLGRLDSGGARVPHRAATELIAYTGAAGDVKFKGVLFAKAEEMPLRVFARARPEGGGCVVELGLDEDFGFQMFVGPAKRAYQEKYVAAMNAMLADLRGVL